MIVPFPESALNEEAGKAFMEDYEEYAKHARLITELYALPKEKLNQSPVHSPTVSTSQMLILNPFQEKSRGMDISFENSQSDSPIKLFATPTTASFSQGSQTKVTEPTFGFGIKLERPGKLEVFVCSKYE